MVLFFQRLLDELGSARRVRHGWRLPDLALERLRDVPGCVAEVREGRLIAKIPVEDGTALFFATVSPAGAGANGVQMLGHVVAQLVSPDALRYPWTGMLLSIWEQEELSGS
jgi:hypothetical protein